MICQEHSENICAVQSAETPQSGGAQDSERYKQFIAQFQAQMEQQAASAHAVKHEPQPSTVAAEVKEEEKEEHLEDAGDEFEFEDVLPSKQKTDGAHPALVLSLLTRS